MCLCGVASSIYSIALVFGNFDSLLTVQIQVLCALLTTILLLHISSDLSLSFGAKLLIQLQKHYDTYV